MPESLRLESQTLDKLSSAPWRLLTTATPLSNAPTALLRPLLDDLVQEESYLEISATTNQPAEIVLAIKLPPERAALWQSNLPKVLNFLSARREGQGEVPGNSTATYQLSTKNHQLILTNIGDWTVLSIFPSINNQLSTINIASRLSTTGLPFAPEATNPWISGRVDFSALSHIAGWSIRSNTHLPVCEFSATGDGTNVRSRLEFTFDDTIPLALNAWKIPTNIMSDQLISFTAIRLPDAGGLKNLLGVDLAGCFDSQQIFVWALRSLPMATYAATPTVSGSPCFDNLSRHLFGPVNDWIATNAIGSFAPNDTGNMITWQGAPFMSAYFQSRESATGNYVIGGLVPTPLTNRAPSLELTTRMMQRPNLVYYDWEYSAPRVESWFYIGQLGRVIFGRLQLTTSAGSVNWLKAVSPKLGNAGTVATLADPKHISVERFSTLGMTAVELHLFADWLESTNFPSGLHTTSTPAKPMLRRKTPLPGAPN